MKKQITKITSGLLVAGLLVTGLTIGASAYAANTEIGATGAVADTEYSLEEMLVYAIGDEYLAQAEYDITMDTYGVQKPFSNIIHAEAAHISFLEPLFEKYGVSVPEKDWKSLVAVPESLEAAYAIGVEAENKNIAMYKSFLNENLPEDVKEVFEALMNASEKHLTAFERQVDGVNGIGNGNGGIGKGNGNGNAGRGNGGKTGVANRKSQGNCELNGFGPRI